MVVVLFARIAAAHIFVNQPFDFSVVDVQSVKIVKRKKVGSFVE